MNINIEGEKAILLEQADSWVGINPKLRMSTGDCHSFVKTKGIDGKDVAKALSNAAKNQSGKVDIYHWKEMNDLL
ncbi:MAG TPA: hypothetical protein VK616_05805 [Flavitalea sp.]|nr:hypothetical protein [Flavitalea sp.]HTF29923.1 hypothetical protein [Flavitalea sp.]